MKRTRYSFCELNATDESSGVIVCESRDPNGFVVRPVAAFLLLSGTMSFSIFAVLLITKAMAADWLASALLVFSILLSASGYALFRVYRSPACLLDQGDDIWLRRGRRLFRVNESFVVTTVTVTNFEIGGLRPSRDEQIRQSRFAIWLVSCQDIKPDRMFLGFATDSTEARAIANDWAERLDLAADESETHGLPTRYFFSRVGRLGSA